MQLRGFLGSHTNKLDAKGRVSIPAAFRSVLKNEEGAVNMVLRPSHQNACIDVWPEALFDAQTTPLERMDLFSEEQADLAAVLFADAYPIEADKEGRIALSASLLAHANVKDTLVFMGLGPIFQIWEPDASVLYRAQARERALAKKLTLPGAQA